MKKYSIVFILLIINHTTLISQEDINKELKLYPEKIIKITFENSNRIKSSFYRLEAAKSNFKLFERKYTKFNPLIVNSTVDTNSDKEFYGDFSVGMSKDFFDGSSITTSVGNSRDWGDITAIKNTNFIKTELNFPLFSSARTLDRVIKRTFEENELYTKNLDYVDAVKSNVKNALEQYYDIVPRIKTYEMLKKYQSELKQIVDNDSLKISEVDKEQIKGEIISLDSKLTGYEIKLYSKQLSLQRYMNTEAIDIAQIYVLNIDFNSPNYLGKYYIEEPIENIYKNALSNDTEFNVLGVIMKNAKEKKKLAEKGKWDIFATTGGRYNFYDVRNGAQQDNFLTVDAGIKIKLFDNKILKTTIAKANSDISAIEFTILDREKLIHSDIERLKDGLNKKKEQLINSTKSITSWKNIYKTKKNQFITKLGSVDNYIQAFRSLISAEETRYDLEGDYLDTIRNFDFITGTYFTQIKLDN